jgi:hypothetical protein
MKTSARSPARSRNELLMLLRISRSRAKLESTATIPGRGGLAQRDSKVYLSS